MFLGITGYNHESSAALVNEEGKLINYYREEVLSRIKGDKSFPKRAIKKIFEEDNISPLSINSVSFYERPLSAFINPLKVAALKIPKSLSLISHQCRNFDKSSISCFLDLSKNFSGLEEKLIYLDHHLAHTLTAIPYSSIQNNICSVVVDGFGDRSTTSISKVNDLYNIKELWSCDYPISLGLFYSAITDFLGFQVNEGEYKVMGLSSFGRADSLVAKKVYELISWDDSKNRIIQDMDFFNYHISPTEAFSYKLIELLGEPRNPFIPLLPNDKNFQYYADIAAGAQKAITDILCSIFKYANLITACNRFLFSGGVALNSASLTKIAYLNFVQEIIVPPSPGDSGASIGAAYYAYLKNKNNPSIFIPNPGLFPSKFKSNYQKTLAKKILSEKFKVLSNKLEDTLLIAARLIKEGEIIGLVLNNAETGPRALGNRSLICDGTNHNSVKKLNTIIKNRSPFRPTAPCMKLNTAKKYYHLQPELSNSYKFMNATCKCKEDSISKDFPTTHVDGTARLQILEDNHFLSMILDYLKSDDIEILANSSLNVSGDPTCFDLIDGLLMCSLKPLKYLLTDFGLLESLY